MPGLCRGPSAALWGGGLFLATKPFGPYQGLLLSPHLQIFVFPSPATGL